MKHGLRIWLHATRPRTLPAAVVPVLMGTALARVEQPLHLPTLGATLLACLLIQIGTNFANDYYDFQKGADTEDRIGPTRATAAGLISPQVMRRAFVWTFALAFLVGIYLVYRGGLPILLIGICSIVCGVAYTGGPFPLAYLGLGEVFVLLFFGPVSVGGTVYVQTLSWSTTAWLVGLSPGLLSAAILVVNNLRDIITDPVAGKNTLAVRFGARFARVEYITLVLSGISVPPLLVLAGWLPRAASCTLLALVPSLWLSFRVATEDGITLNPRLGQTGALLVVTGLLFALGVSLSP